MLFRSVLLAPFRIPIAGKAIAPIGKYVSQPEIDPGGICKLNGTLWEAKKIQTAARNGSEVLAYALPAIAHARKVITEVGTKVNRTLRILCVIAGTNTRWSLASSNYLAKQVRRFAWCFPDFNTSCF